MLLVVRCFMFVVCYLMCFSSLLFCLVGGGGVVVFVVCCWPLLVARCLFIGVVGCLLCVVRCLWCVFVLC